MHQTRIKAHAGGYSRSKYACPDSRRRPNSFKQKHNLTYEVINAMIMGREDTTVQAAARLLSINRKLYYPSPHTCTYLSFKNSVGCKIPVCAEGIAECFGKVSKKLVFEFPNLSDCNFVPLLSEKSSSLLFSLAI